MEKQLYQHPRSKVFKYHGRRRSASQQEAFSNNIGAQLRLYPIMAEDLFLEHHFKHHKANEKKLLSDLPSDQFASMIGYYSGPQVTVIVESKKYTLPKGLLCYSSSFFNAAFNGDFQEGEKQEVTLPSISQDAFELVIKWMYVGALVLPDKITSDESFLTILLDFATAADFLGLRGPTPNEAAAIVISREPNPISVKNRATLKAKHLRHAMSLPSGHPLRVIIVKLCVGVYIHSLSTETEFIFAQEIIESGEFATDFFEMYDKTIRRKFTED